MNRSQVAALVGVVVLLGGAVAYGERARSQPDAEPRPDPRIAELRLAADLAPCPAGLGPELPDLELACLGGGEPVDLTAAPPGRPTLVNVWATWCPPCVEEVPDLVAFAEKAGDRVGLVGVLTQDTEENGLEFSRQFGIGYPSLVDPDGEVFRAFRPGPPVTLFLDAQGTVRHKVSGKVDSLEQLEALVAEHLGVSV